MKLMTLVEGLGNKITLTTSREIESFAKNYNTWTDKITSARDSLDHLEEDLKLYHDNEKKLLFQNQIRFHL